ncbi:MAG: GTPase HflX, partial [Rhodospirillaceae bacterium]|nr:GTPase HflX [Rhodospirillaceae bacterium]
RLTGAQVTAQDQLFATLDPTMRAVTLPSGRTIILSDTVGFVSALPTSLVAAFRATLEEVLEADLILHVRDIAHPDTIAQKDDVMNVLDELGVEENRKNEIIEVRNKIDLIDDDERHALLTNSSRNDHAVALSAITGEGSETLLEAIDGLLDSERKFLDVAIDLSDGAAIAWLYERGEVVSRHDDGNVARIRVGLDAANAARFEQRFNNRGSAGP